MKRTETGWKGGLGSLDTAPNVRLQCGPPGVNADSGPNHLKCTMGGDFLGLKSAFALSHAYFYQKRAL